MKRTFLSVVAMTLFSFSSFAAEKAVFASGDQFHQSCEQDHFCSSFTIDLKESDAEFLAFTELVEENASVLAYTFENGKLSLSIKASTADSNAYAKVFNLLGVQTIEMTDASGKTDYTVEDFLNKYL